MKAIILAGGKGSRLAPYTTILPKPLMPIGDIPILEVVIRQLKYYGFKEIVLAVGYLAELIRAYLGDGSKYGVKIEYSREEEPLGTAGPLTLIKNLSSTFLVMNSDILTTLDYRKLIDSHKENGAIATISMCKRNIQVDFGIIKISNKNELVDYVEKPILDYLVSMGIYVFEPKVLEYIKPSEKLDFPDLVRKLLRNNEKVVGYYSKDFWLDIGRRDDYEIARREFMKMKDKFLGAV